MDIFDTLLAILLVIGLAIICCFGTAILAETSRLVQAKAELARKQAELAAEQARDIRVKRNV